MSDLSLFGAALLAECLLGGVIEGQETARLVSMATDMESVIRELVESAA